MPTRNRRLLITPTPEIWRVLDEFHQVTGRAKASVAVEFLGAVTAQMHEIVNILRQVRDLDEAARDEVAAASEQAMRRIGVLVEYASGEVQALAPGSKQPPSSNTGVTNPRNGPSSRRRKAA